MDDQQDLSDGQHYTDHDQPQMQCSPSSGGDKAARDQVNYSNYDVNDCEEQNHDKRQSHHHHHHHNKYMNSKDDNESTINHVILITVINPHYPITCDLIHQICGSYGKVNRIVIFKKNGVQAMVEFDNVESAKRAKAMLHGCDIYSGCCRLKIEYAKPSRLNVHRNDSESFDYTDPTLGGSQTNQASGDSGRNDGHHHSNNDHHLHRGNHSHRSRRAGTGDRRGVVGNGSDVMNNGEQDQADQFHSSHMHQPPGGHHQHSKPISSQALGDQQQQQHQGAYVMNQNMDASIVNNDVSGDDAFHQQHQDGSGFDIPRGNLASNSVSATHQHNFGGSMDTFIPTSTAQQSTTQHGGMYQQRQDDGHHHHHHHHTNQSHHHQSRGGGRLTEGGSSRGHNHHNPPFPLASPLMASGGGSHHQGTVLMVYGLSVDRVNCDRLFNLFCLYGNVVRVKFLRTKEGCAMVQMGDVLAMDRCFSSLNKTILFGNELQLSYSKQAFLHDVLQPFTLPDGSPSFKDFMGSKNNRFRNPEVASKNRILPPSRVLHFFNAPLGISDEELMVLFKQATSYEPVSLKIFPPKVDNAKSISGLVTFRDPAEATEALVLCNHMSIPKAGVPHPYVLRLCFSPPTYC